MKRISFVLCLYLPVFLFSHGVNVFAYQEGDSVHIQSYFSSGDPVRFGKIEVYDANNKLLYQCKTDEKGNASFKYQEGMRRIVLKAGMGHRAETSLEPVDTENVLSNDEKIGSTSSKELREIKELLLRLERRRIMVTQVFGGIGYIFGILGMWLFFRERYGKREQN